MKLVEDNVRPHIHSDVLNYLTEEGINIMAHLPYSPDLAPYSNGLNDYMKRNLIDEANEKWLVLAVSKVMKNISEKEFLTDC